VSWNVARVTLRSGLCAVALAAASAAGVAAQGVPPDAGIVVGLVANCVNNVEQPIQGASVNATGSSLDVITDQNGQFALGLPAGTYTINVSSSAGNGSRPSVPVDAGELLDVGTIDVGPAAVTGCGPEEAVQTPAATVAPTAATALTLGPTEAPAATAVPATLVPTAAPAPATTTTDESSPDQTAPGDTTPQPDDTSDSSS
jgi:Carboxypeptidase regulatory-like domain